MRVAYLSCRQTLPGSPERRNDASEHDRMTACLGEAFAAHGAEIPAVSWDDDDADWVAYDAALIGSTWDYQDRLDEFLARLATIESQTLLLNPSAVVRWNCRKTYLRELAERGVPTIPTRWIDRVDEDGAADAFASLGADDLVFKRQIGAGAEGQHRVRRHEPLPAMPEPMMAQPFLPAIAEEGEYSFVFVDGALSHALVKTAAAGDYRIQSAYGGRERPVSPPAADRAAAEAVLRALDETPLYARVDMVRGEGGGLLLMELELIEPYLYPVEGEGLGERIYEALRRRLRTI